jgi:apolipoprotein N-acyltransferase
MTRPWLPLAGATATGALLGLCARIEAPWHLVLLVALVPWLSSLERASIGLAAASGALCSVVFTATGFGWFPDAVRLYAGAPPALAWAVTLILAPVLLQPQLVLAAMGRQAAARLGAPRWATGAAFVLCWGAAEWALPRLFGDSLSYGLHPSSGLRQAADLVGALGLTLVILTVNALAAAALRARSLRLAGAAAALVAATWGYGSLRHRSVEARVDAAPTLRAGVVQANITRYDKLAAQRGMFEAVEQIVDTHLAMSARLLETGPLDVLVWPETVYPTTYGAPRTEAGADFDRMIAGLVERAGIPLVFGAFERAGELEYNAAFFLEPAPEGGTRHQTYRKTMLFPMTEHVPGWMDSAWLRRTLPWTGRWTRGPGPRSVRLQLAGGRALVAVPLICYEVTDADFVLAGASDGADFILTISNDSWFAPGQGPRLHLLSAAFRSIEAGLPQLRATNSGISALIMPTGELRAESGFDTPALLHVEVPLAATRAPFASWGRALGPLLVGLAVLLLGGLLLRARRRARR